MHNGNPINFETKTVSIRYWYLLVLDKQLSALALNKKLMLWIIQIR